MAAMEPAGNNDILIVIPDIDAREEASRLFERAGYRTSQVAMGEEALERSSERAPLLVLLDLELTDMSGFEACYELRERLGEGPPIILISGERTEPGDRVAGLNMGADDFLSKPFDPDELIARARRLLTRSGDRSTPAMDIPLTARETEVLQLLADGLTQDAIAEKLFISPKTVATHIQRIITKLGVHSRTEAVALAYKSGLAGEPRTEEIRARERDQD